MSKDLATLRQELTGWHTSSTEQANLAGALEIFESAPVGDAKSGEKIATVRAAIESGVATLQYYAPLARRNSFTG